MSDSTPPLKRFKIEPNVDHIENNETDPNSMRIKEEESHDENDDFGSNESNLDQEENNEANKSRIKKEESHDENDCFGSTESNIGASTTLTFPTGEMITINGVIDSINIPQEMNITMNNNDTRELPTAVTDNSIKNEPITDMAFCCYICNCSEKRKQRSGYIAKSCTNAGNDSIYHNFCCHEISKEDDSEDWLPPIQTTILGEDTIDDAPQRLISLSTLEKIIRKANEADKKYQRQSLGCELNDVVLDTDPFNSNESNKLGPLTILNIFSNVGSSIVALKKLGIAIKTFISVEDDPVARSVFEFNHINDNTDNIKFVQSTSEEIFKDPVSLLCEYGPIDLVLSTIPPCGAEKTGFYIKKVGKLLSQLEKNAIQNHHNVLHLLESSAVCKGASYKSIPTIIDSGDVSPISQKLAYWTNIPIPQVTKSHHTPTFDDNFVMPGVYLHACQNKAKSLQPSSLDDDRNLKVRKIESSGKKRFEVQPFSVSDIEKILGFQVGYVSTALNDLFDHLRNDAFNIECEEGLHWIGRLDEKYYDMAKCSYRFKKCSSDDLYQILISAPTETTINENTSKSDQKVFFNKEQYAKYLLSTSSSIATLEFVLSPLKKICERRVYDSFDYDFNWL